MVKKAFIISILSLFASQIFAQFNIKIEVVDSLKSSGDTLHLCQTQVKFKAIATYYDDTEVNDTLARFSWDFGDGTPLVEGQFLDSVYHTYVEGGAYYLRLSIIDINEDTVCLIKPIRVSRIPIFENTRKTIDHAICLGDEIDLIGEVKPDPWDFEPQRIVNEDFGLKINHNFGYVSEITHRLYEPGQTLENTDSMKVCINLEHSDARSVQVELECPDGTSIILKEAAGDTAHYFGEPVAGILNSGAKGMGYDYCWTNTPDYDIMQNEFGIYTFTYTDDKDSTYTGVYHLPTGEYTPYQPFSDLIGCPLNGDWTIRVIEQEINGEPEVYENGHLFGWQLDFGDTLTLPMWEFKNEYPFSTDIYWRGVNVSSTIMPNPEKPTYEATAQPDTFGTTIYHFIVKDDYGCTYDTIIDVEVTPATFTYSPESGQAPIDINFENTTEWGHTFDWDFDDGETSTEQNPVHEYVDKGKREENMYRVIFIATSDQNCQHTDTAWINIEPPPSDFEVPNVFTPNGDNSNEVFKIKISETNKLKEFTCRIYSRYGHKIYEWSDWENGGWDGKIGNREASEGIYFYVIEAKGKDDVKHEFKGHFYLFK